MFGCPVYHLQGKRYALLHGNRVVLALSPEHTAELIGKGGQPWEPMKGGRSKDKVVVPKTIAANVRSLRPWIQRAVQHANPE